MMRRPDVGGMVDEVAPVMMQVDGGDGSGPTRRARP